MAQPQGYVEADVQEVVQGIQRAASEARNEEDLRIRTEHVLRNLLERLGVAWASYEYTLVEGRPDALYGRVVIEYELPGKLSTDAGFRKAVEQAEGYIAELAASVEVYPKYFGVVLDGHRIGFVRFRKGWDVQGPFPVSKETVLKLLEAIRGLRRKPLRADLLNKDLGPESYAAKVVVNGLYQRLKQSRSPRVEMLFEDWKRVFRQVCGYSPDKIRGLEELYGLRGEVDYEALLFSVHTYYALAMKLLAAEVAVSLGDSYLQSYIKRLEDAYLRGTMRLRDMLADLEEGAIFAKIGIKNFLEADYFAWYLDMWDEPLAEAVSKLAKTLSEYEPATAELEPDQVKDMLKRLYQYLVPKKIRHDLGEYYTPDWLADLVINEVGYNGDLEKRLLDPACGSGTFLVLAIKRAKQYALDKFIHESDALDTILRNIVGFDLNPLAVVAARTNYLIALGEFIRYRKGSIEIPVYLADSILVERKSTLTGTAYVLRTIAAEFMVPAEVVERGLLANVLTIVEECVRSEYAREEFRARLLREVDIGNAQASILAQLYATLLKLEDDKRNRIWVSLLKNSFAPLFAGKFDYVVGNPPWVNWGNLPEEYRNSSKQMWEAYGLVAQRRGRASLGKASRDMAMLFTYASIDRYLKNGGLFGFLITQTAFKSMAAEGFRRFSVPSGSPFKVTKTHDLVELLPFEGAQNRTAAMKCLKGEETSYPVPYILWKGPSVDQDLGLDEVSKITSRFELEARPLSSKTGPWSTLKPAAHQAVAKTVGRSTYVAHKGVNFPVIGAFWVKITGRHPDNNILVENITEGTKVSIKELAMVIEPELVYPLIRGADVSKWKVTPQYYIICPHDHRGSPLPETEVKVKYPKTYTWFHELKDVIRSVRQEPYRSAFKSGRVPTYWLFNVKPALSPYKVVWRYIAAELQAAVVGTIGDEYLGERVVVPYEKLMVVPCNDIKEAHYLCSVLNSCIARLLVKSYAIETQISTHVLEYVKVPRFDPQNRTHITLAELSEQAHKAVAGGRERDVGRIEDQIDGLVAQLFGLSDEELKEVKESLKILQCEVVSGIEEVESERVMIMAKPEGGPRRALEGLIERFEEEES